MEWKNGEVGPTCFCGMPTSVLVNPDTGDASLACILHSGPAGALFPLPKNKRPIHWPNVTDDEMVVLVDDGFKEQNTVEGSKVKVEIDFSPINQPDRSLN